MEISLQRNLFTWQVSHRESSWPRPALAGVHTSPGLTRGSHTALQTSCRDNVVVSSNIFIGTSECLLLLCLDGYCVKRQASCGRGEILNRNYNYWVFLQLEILQRWRGGEGTAWVLTSWHQQNQNTFLIKYIQAARHLMGLHQAKYALGPGRRWRRSSLTLWGWK